jgi:hypothetical protein
VFTGRADELNVLVRSEPVFKLPGCLLALTPPLWFSHTLTGHGPTSRVRGSNHSDFCFAG